MEMQHFVLRFPCRGEAGDETSSHWSVDLMGGKRAPNLIFGAPRGANGDDNFVFFFLNGNLTRGGGRFDAFERVLEVRELLQVAEL
jgi:hypothetical protein